MDWRILYNPLAVLGRGTGLAVAILVIVVLTAVAWWGGVHLDGALDLHLTVKPPSGPLIIGESLIDWLSLGLLLFVASRIFGGNGGAGAFLAGVGLSRFPYILAAIIGSKPVLGKAMQAAVSVGRETVTVRPQAFMTPGLIIGSLAMLGLIIWSIVILYLGYKEASRLQGGKTAASFVIGLIVAELVSKLLLVGLFHVGIGI